MYGFLSGGQSKGQLPFRAACDSGTRPGPVFRGPEGSGLTVRHNKAAIISYTCVITLKF